MKPVSSKNAPAAIGPYSQAIVANDLVFVSGMIALDPASGTVVGGGIREQTARALANLKAVLEAAGTNEGRVVKTTVFLKDGSYFKDMNEAYSKFFGDHKPARSTVVTGFPREDLLVEIEAVASL